MIKLRSLLLPLALLVSNSCSPQPQRMAGQTMGSQWSVVCHGATVQELQPRIQTRLTELEQTFSHWQPSSELSQFNAAQDTDWHPLSPDMAKVIHAALQVAAETEGALDITLAPLVELWGFGPSGRRSSPPTEQQIAAARARCGWQQLQLRDWPGSSPSLRKTLPALQLNLSALAEGYAADEVTALLRAAGVPAALVDVGGELRAYGLSPDGKPWRIGIQHPSGQGMAQLVDLQDSAVATSGTYRQGYTAGTQRYSHILDPRTARPVSHAVASVSVQHPQAMLADAYATALLVLGRQQGTALAERLGLKCLFLEASPALPHLGMQKP